MGHWNYRVMRHSTETKEHWFGIHEVYYNEDGEVEYWTTHDDDPVNRGDFPFGETESDLQSDLRMMLKAFDLPVLDAITGKEIDG